ncbi:MAG: extracellular solute-binding protein, partial [Natronospirillum sp.]
MSQPIEVLHWWTSEGERAAADLLRDHMAEYGVEWQDRAIHGGGGESAMAVLKAQIIAGDPPGAAQIIGPNIKHWSDLGYLQTLDEWAVSWPGSYYATIDAPTLANGVRSAVPVSIHRINWMWLNAEVYRQHQLTPPTSWSQVFQDAETLQAAGIIPLAHGGQPWQTATLFETLLLSVAGPAFYREYFVKMSPAALQDPRVAEALALLRDLQAIMDEGLHNRQ